MTKHETLMLILGIAVAGAAAVAAAVHAPQAGGSPAAATSGPPALGLDRAAVETAAAGQMMPMRNMMHRMMPDMVPPGVEPENLPEPDGRGARLLVRYCWQCHNLPSPAMHSAAEWPGIADRMFYRIDRMSGMMGIESPSQDDRAAILEYLKTNAMKSIPEASIPAAGSPGAALFKEFCTRCHALPDPKSHTPAEWAAILEKMQANMKVMNRKTMTATQQDEILVYLDTNARKP
jgi:cytochrome c5